MKKVVLVDPNGYVTLVEVNQDPIAGQNLTVPPGGSLEGSIIDGRLEPTGHPGYAPSKVVVHIVADLGMKALFGGNFPSYKYKHPDTA